MSFQCLAHWPGENGETYMSLLDTKLPQLGEEARPRYRCAVRQIQIRLYFPAQSIFKKKVFRNSAEGLNVRGYAQFLRTPLASLDAFARARRDFFKRGVIRGERDPSVNGDLLTLCVATLH